MALLILSMSPSSFGQAGREAGGEVLIPGGEGFIRSVLGMAPRDLDRYGQGFLVEVVNQLSQPTALNYPVRLRRAVDNLEDLRQFLAALDTKYGETVARLSAPGSDAYRRAEELLDYFGLRVREGDGVLRHERVDSEQATSRRRLLAQLGISLPVQMQLGATGQPIVLEIHDTMAAIPFGAAAWQQQVFEGDVGTENILRSFMADERARDILLAYAQMDRQTRELLYQEIGLRDLHQDSSWARGLRRLAPYLRAQNETLLLPGGDRAAWETILEPWNNTAELVRKASTAGGGRAAHLWRALSLIPEARAHYLLTLNGETEEERSRWASRLYLSIRLPEFGNPIRWPDDAAELFIDLRLDPGSGSLAWPGGARAWLAAFRRPEEALHDPGALDEMFQELAAQPDSGPLADSVLLLTLLVNFDPRGEVTPAIRGFLAVSEALRYQPGETAQRSVPLLYRSYDRFGRAYGFLTVPTPLSPLTVEKFVAYLHRIDSTERSALRVDTIRQHQATLILLHRLLANDVVPSAQRDSLLQRLFDIEIEPVAGPGMDAAEETATEQQSPRGTDYGTALIEYLRFDLIPAVGRKLVTEGWQGDPTDLRAVLVAGLVGQMPRAPLEVEGILFEYAPTINQSYLLERHLRQQQTPPVEMLFQLDAIIAQIGELPTSEEAAGRADLTTADHRRMSALAEQLEIHLEELRDQLPPGVLDDDTGEAPPVPIPRSRLFERGESLVQQLREGSPHPVAAISTRRAVTSFLGDALVGYVYALHMGDPDAVIYQRRYLSWLHRRGPEEIPGGMPLSLYGPWAPTKESRTTDGDHRLINSLYGVAGILGHWNLELALPPELTSVEPLAEEVWGSMLGDLHYPAFDRTPRGSVIRRHARGEAWIRAAVAARDPYVMAPSTTPGEAALESHTLAETLRPLLSPFEYQRFVDAVEAGNEQSAISLVSPGNRYLLARSVDGGDAGDPARVRWALDQVAGMPMGRSGDYLGLGHPPAVPQGEVGDDLRDPRLYTRLLDIRIRLAIELERQGLPAALGARLLTYAMAQVLSNARPLIVDRWRSILAALDKEITDRTVKGWILDMAFADELILPGEPMMPGSRQLP